MLALFINRVFKRFVYLIFVLVLFMFVLSMLILYCVRFCFFFVVVLLIIFLIFFLLSFLFSSSFLNRGIILRSASRYVFFYVFLVYMLMGELNGCGWWLSISNKFCFVGMIFNGYLNFYYLFWVLVILILSSVSIVMWSRMVI